MTAFDFAYYLGFRVKPKPGGKPRKDHRVRLECESVEDRVVLSQMGARPLAFRGADIASSHYGTSTYQAAKGVDLIGALRELGIVVSGSSLRASCAPPTSSDATLTTLLDNLKTALDKLSTDSQALAAKSAVTVADISALTSDMKAIRDAGVTVSADSLKSVLNQIAFAVAGDSDLTQVKADFTALFDGTSLAQETIDKTFSDLVTVIDHSAVTVDDLNLIAADKAAVDTATQALKDAGYDQVRGKHGRAKPLNSTLTGTSGSTTSIAAIGRARRFAHGR